MTDRSDSGDPAPSDPINPADGAEAGPSDEERKARSARRSLGRNVGATLGAQGASWLGALVVLTLLPRYLGDIGIGQFRIATSVWLVANAFIMWGTQRSVTLDVARTGQAEPILSAVIWLRLINFFIASAVISVTFWMLGIDPTIIALCAIAGAGILPTTIGTTALATLQGLENFTAPAQVILIGTIATPLVTVIGILADVGLFGMAALTAAVTGGVAVLNIVFLTRYVTIDWSLSVDDVIAAFRRGTPFLLGSVALALYREADVLVMSAFLDDEQVGWYAAADRLFGTALMIPTVVMTTMLPVLTRLHVDAPDQARGMAERTFRSLMLIGLPCGAGLFLIGNRLAVVLFGSDFVGAGPVLSGLGLVVALVSMTTLLGRYALAIGREKIQYAMIFTAAAMTVPLDAVFVPFTNERYDNGAIGGAISFAITEALILVAGVAIFLPSVVSRSTGVRLAKAGLCTGLMAGAIYPLRDLFPVIPVAVGAVVFVAAVLALRVLEDHEREIVDRVVGRVLPSRFT